MRIAATALASLALLSPTAVASDVYRTVTLDHVEFLSGETPDLDRTLGAWELRGWPQPQVTVQSAEEAFLGIPYRDQWGTPDTDLGALELSVQAGAEANVRGVLVLPGPGGEATRHHFVVNMQGATEAGRTDFLLNRFLHYSWLHSHDLPGAAWFRYQADTTREQLAELGVDAEFDPDATMRGFRGRRHDVERTYGLFTGGRAAAENLALDEVVEPIGDDTHMVAIDTLEGITTTEIDWTPLVEGLEPELDPLAWRVPHDQHGVFFPTFASMLRVVDEARANGAPVLELFDASSEDARTQARYERQLCLPLSAAARIMGGQLVESVAITGGDPYLRTGSDVALIFRAKNPQILEAYLSQRQEEAAAESGAHEVSGATRAGGYPWRGVSTPDRVVCSYLMRIETDVVVTNSIQQLERIAEVASGDVEPLAALDEYVFFRDRYRRGEDEDAFVVLSDATIRRWCSPHWRIGASRRTRAAALLSNQCSADLAARLSGETLPSGIAVAAMPMPGSGPMLRTDDVLRSEVYGTDQFLTPIGELDMDLVTRAEMAGYNGFRATYMRRWREFFDPIAARLVVREDRLQMDMSVVPLVFRSEYRDLIDVTRGTDLPPMSGDLHDTTLHFAMAIGRESRFFRMLRDEFLTSIVPGLTDPLAWLGDDLTLYLDNDPVFWEEMGANGDPEEFLEENLYRLPIGARLSSKDPLRMAAFVTGLRSFMLASAPNLVRFEQREHEGRGYVALIPEDDGFVGDQPLRLYYVTLPDSLLFSLREDVVQRAIDRYAARKSGTTDEAPLPWLGKSAGLRVGPGFQAFLEGTVGDEWQNDRARLSWRTLPILNEWKRIAPDVDPVAFHAEHWGVVLTCPGGAGFEWDEQWQTMSSKTFGSALAPRHGRALPELLYRITGASFGITFENDGLRASVAMER